LKFKALQERAKEKIANIAESREPTVAELEDRLARDRGIDENRSFQLGLGPTRFHVRLFTRLQTSHADPCRNVPVAPTTHDITQATIHGDNIYDP
ncbi:hypothetical protein, partial [Escherichia coli]|uniref:hypothetical protein n=1 Tax=Escherichia coli TaxID=562 RepID=UPI0010CC37E5